MLSLPMYYALAAAVLLLLVWFVRNDAAEYAAFKALTGTEERQRAFRRWTLRAFLFFFGGALLVLLAIGRIDALWRLPPEFAGPARAAAAALADHDDDSSAMPLVLVVSGALVAGALLGTLLARRKRTGKPSGPVVVGDIAPLFPRNAAERRWTALLAANAGPSEEIFFRLMLPLILTLATGRPLLAFAVAAIVFGLVHFYQGWVGVAGTMVVGAVFTGLYLVTGSIWVPVVLHSLMNLNTLWLRPWLAALAERRAGA